MRESGQSPEHNPLLYAQEPVVHGVSRSLGGNAPEKAEQEAQERFRSQMREPEDRRCVRPKRPPIGGRTDDDKRE